MNEQDRETIAEAVRQAESETSGEIVVMIDRAAASYRTVPVVLALTLSLFVPWPLLALTATSAPRWRRSGGSTGRAQPTPEMAAATAPKGSTCRRGSGRVRPCASGRRSPVRAATSDCTQPCSVAASRKLRTRTTKETGSPRA